MAAYHNNIYSEQVNDAFIWRRERKEKSEEHIDKVYPTQKS